MVTESIVTKYIDKTIYQLNTLGLNELNNVLRLIQERVKNIEANALMIRGTDYTAYANIALQGYTIDIDNNDTLGIYNVRDYGALGNNPTVNDRPFIQATIDAAIAAGEKGLVYFPGRRYFIDAPLNVLTNGPGIVLMGAGWNQTTIYGTFAGYMINFDWTGSGNGNWRSGIKNMHIQRPTDVVGQHGLIFGRCVSPFVKECLIENCDTGIRVGDTGANMTQKMDISHVDFLSCNNNIYLGSFVECRASHIHGDQPGVTWLAAGNSVIYANPAAGDYFDSLWLHDIDGFVARAYGIYINVTTGTAGVNGRNHIGDWDRVVFEAATTNGIYVDAPVANCFGRLSISQYYGDSLSINNVENFRPCLVESHGANTFTNLSPSWRFIANNVAGAGNNMGGAVWGPEDATKNFNQTYTAAADTLIEANVDCAGAAQGKLDGLLGGNIRASASGDATVYNSKGSLMMICERGQTWRVNTSTGAGAPTYTLIIKELQ